MLREIAELESGRVLLTGGPKRLARIYLNAWIRRGKAVLAEYLPFQVEGEVVIGSPFESGDFDVYLIVNPISKSSVEKEMLYTWLSKHSNRLVLLYESKYIADSITRYRIRQFVDYLIAYKRETVGFERIEAMRLKGGKVIGRKTYVRRR